MPVAGRLDCAQVRGTPGWPPPELFVTVTKTAGTRPERPEQRLQRVDVLVRRTGARRRGRAPPRRRGRAPPRPYSTFARVVSKCVLLGRSSRALDRREEDLLGPSSLVCRDHVLEREQLRTASRNVNQEGEPVASRRLLDRGPLVARHAPVPESVSRSSRTSSTCRAKRLCPRLRSPPAGAPGRHPEMFTEWIRKGSEDRLEHRSCLPLAETGGIRFLPEPRPRREIGAIPRAADGWGGSSRRRLQADQASGRLVSRMRHAARLVAVLPGVGAAVLVVAVGVSHGGYFTTARGPLTLVFLGTAAAPSSSSSTERGAPRAGRARMLAGSQPGRSCPPRWSPTEAAPRRNESSPTRRAPSRFALVLTRGAGGFLTRCLGGDLHRRRRRARLEPLPRAVRRADTMMLPAFPSGQF